MHMYMTYLLLLFLPYPRRRTMEGPGEEAITLARRAVVSRRLFFSHRIVRPLFGLMGFDLLCAFVFAALPDSRTAESDQASATTQNAAKPFPGVYARAAAVCGLEMRLV